MKINVINIGLICTAFFMACQKEKMVQLVTVPSSDPTVSVRLWFHIGSQNDPTGKEGLASMTALVLTNGATLVNSYDEILKKLYPMAASYDAQVDKEQTIIYGRVHRDNWQSYYQLLTDALLQPAFKEEDFNRLKSQTLNYLERTLLYANDEELGKQALYQFIFTGTGYAHPVAGLIESVKGITLEDVKKFYHTFYSKYNVTIGLGGSVDDSMVKQMKKDLTKLPTGHPVIAEPPMPEAINGLQVLLIEKKTQSTAISIGFPIELLRGDDDFFSMWLANSWFGEHRNSSSHLYQVIREARGMNYGDYSYIEAFPDGGRRQFPPANVARRQQIFEIWLRPVTNDGRHFALRAALRELQNLVDNGLNQEQFELTQKFLGKYYLNFASSTMDRLGCALDDKFYDLDKSFLSDFPQKIAALTRDEVNTAIKRQLQYQNLKIVIVTDNAEQLKADLVANKQSPMAYRTPKRQTVLDEDKEIAKYHLPIAVENIRIVPGAEMFKR